MRNVVFKNITSPDKRRKVISSAEIVDNQGVHTVIRRHFICLIKELGNNAMQKPAPYVYVLKEHNTKEAREKFFCKVKGSVIAWSNGALYLFVFMHSLSIHLTPDKPNLKVV